MPRKIASKQSFLGGEAGAQLEGRSDLPQHQLGCSKLLNFIPLKSGATTRRPGTRYVKGTQGNVPARLIKYIASYDSGADIYVVEIAKASSTSLTFRVVRVSDNSVYTPANSPLTVDSTINIDEIQYGQIGETMILCHKAFTPQVLRRTTSAPAFSLDPYIALPNVSSRPEYYSVPYRDSNITAITLTASASTVGTGRTITASANFFDAGHVGAYFRHTESATVGWFKVTGYTSPTQVTAEILVALGGTAGTTDWQESAWSTYRGFPRTITFYNQRTIFGGNTSQPDTFWASQTSDYFQMHDVPGTPGVADPQSFILASQSINQIRWMVGGKKLTIGTSRSEWVGQFVEEGTNLKVQFDEETTHGSAYLQPEKSAYTIPFVQRSRQVLREMVFDFNADAYVATDLNLFANHIGTPYGRFASSNNVYISQIAFQESPFNILWVIDSVGRLYGLTRDKQQQIAAWHSHQIGGYMTEFILTGLVGDDYPAFVTSICVVPDPNGRKDRLWMVVRRAIDGVDTYFVEYMDDIKSNPNLLIGSATDVKPFLDCASISSGAAATVWTGFTRFAGEEVYVIAQNGALNVFSGLLEVNGSGEITLPRQATLVCVGIHADAEIRPLPIEGGDAPEIKMRSLKKIDAVAIRMYETWGLRIGRDRIMRIDGNEEQSTFEPIPFDTGSNQPTVKTFTGVKEVSAPGDCDVDASYTLAMQEPWPCTVLSLASRVVANEV